MPDALSLHHPQPQDHIQGLHWHQGLMYKVGVNIYFIINFIEIMQSQKLY